MLTWQPPFDRQKILDVINTIPEVANWRASSGAIFVVTLSSVSTHHLANTIRAKLPALTFVMAAISGHAAQGNTDQETWDFINNPRPLFGVS
jgi:hypothetical protein